MQNLLSKRTLRYGALLVTTVLGSLNLASGQTWTAATSGNWSDSANWTGGVPATSGATVTLNGTSTAINSTVDSAWAASGSVTGLTFNMLAGNFTLSSGAGVTGFSIGSGGISSTNTATVGNTSIQLPIILSASQTWDLRGAAGLFRLDSGSLNVASGLTLTKTGTQTLYVSNLSAGGTFAGNFVVDQGQVSFSGPTQYNRLGTNITWKNSNATSPANFNYNGVTSGASVSANYIFSELGAGGSTYNLNVSNSTATGSMNFNGNWSSTNTSGSASPLLHYIQLWNPLNPTNSDFSNAFTYNIQGNNSGLTSTQTGGTSATGAIRIRSGIWVVDSSTALGTSNGLSVSIGEFSSASSGLVAGLWTNGNNVTSNIVTSVNGGTGIGEIVTIGNSKTSGTATFSGSINMTQSATAGKAPTVHLVANAGGRANFSGNIADTGTGGNVSTVTIKGNGTVALSGTNSYAGDTTVIGNTTLLANSPSGSSTGTGNLTVSSGAILGGSGFLAPGTGKAITAQSGSFIAPGDGGIGTLTLNGSGTASTLLTVASGAKFSFDLGASNASDTIRLFNYVSGDLALAGNTIDFTGAQEGTFALFKFYSDSGSTLMASGLSSGLVIGTGITPGLSASFNYTNTGFIELVVVPEPSTWALLAFTLTTVVVLRRHRGVV